jgi:hypothetical protein
MLDHILSSSGSLFIYSRTLVVFFLVLAVVNFGKNLDYKLDNVFITMGVVYLTFTGLNLNIDAGAYCFYSWMYGFSWSLGL